MAEPEPRPFDLFEWLLSSFRPFEIMSGAATMIWVISWFLQAPAPLLYILGTAAFMCGSIGIAGHIKSAAERPTLQLGTLWGETNGSENKKKLDLPLQQPKDRTLPIASSATAELRERLQPEEKPNLVFRRAITGSIYSQLGLVLEEGKGWDKFPHSLSYWALTLPVENEFSERFKTIAVSNITAQLFYEGKQDAFQVNRGAWLEQGNRANFQVNDVQSLIVAVAPPERDLDKGPFAVAICKEYQAKFDGIEDIARDLYGEYYRVRVRLLSEDLGVVYADQEFGLVIEHPFDMDLVPIVEKKRESPLNAS